MPSWMEGVVLEGVRMGKVKQQEKSLLRLMRRGLCSGVELLRHIGHQYIGNMLVPKR